MASIRPASRAVSALVSGLSRPSLTTVRWASYGRSLPRRLRRRGGRGYSSLFYTVLVAGAAYYVYSQPEAAKKTAKSANVVIPKAEIEFEKPRKTTGSAQDDDAIGVQHRQIQSSLANPGVYAWGSNAGRVVAPGSKEAVVKEPRRLSAFDGQVLRDLRLDRDAGVAVTEKGDVLQWGVAFWGKDAAEAAASSAPVATLIGKDIVKVALSQDRVIALASNGTVYSLPVSQADQQQQSKNASLGSQLPSSSSSSSSSWGLWASQSSPSAANARNTTPRGLSWGERVVDVSSGLEHCLLLTSKGRVFSAVSSVESFPSRGQLGLPGVTWESRPAGPLDQPHEVPGLRGITASQIATGDRHSLVLSRDGRLFAFGDNAAGQLGISASPTFPSTDEPVQVPVDALYGTRSSDVRVLASRRPNAVQPPKVTSIAAGGATSFFTVDAEVLEGEEGQTPRKRQVADTWACGSGLYGTLGTGKWVHISTGGASKVKALSGLAEYSEAQRKMVPIRLASLAVGATHASAVLANTTNVKATTTAQPGETSWGADVLWWGGNEFYQLGTGKRNNISEPVHIGPLDRALPDQGGGPEPKARLLDGDRERLEIAPRTAVALREAGGRTRKVSSEQRVVCGRFVSAVYSAT